MVRCSLVVGLMCIVCCRLVSIARCCWLLLVVARYFVVVVRCSLCVVRYSLSFVVCGVFVCSLVAACCLLFNDCYRFCSVFAVCVCLLLVVC